jgi:hypothetical protein
MTEKKHGNNIYWCFIPDEWNGKEIAIWKGPEGSKEIIARAKNKYVAKMIIDALLKFSNEQDSTALTKKELAFLEFVEANYVEPYSTMAANAILWADKEAYKSIKSQFPVIYS